MGLIRRRGSTDVEARSHGSAFALVFFLVLLLVLAALYAVGYDYVISVEHEDRAFEETEDLVKRGFYLTRDVLKPLIA